MRTLPKLSAKEGNIEEVENMGCTEVEKFMGKGVFKEAEKRYRDDLRAGIQQAVNDREFLPQGVKHTNNNIVTAVREKSEGNSS